MYGKTIILILAISPILFAFSKNNLENYRKRAFIDAATLAICETLENGKMGRNGSGRRPYGHFLKTTYIRDIVTWTLDAAPLNPALGDPHETTIKLLSAFYGESGLHPTIVNSTLNKDGSIDKGLTQRNSIHNKAFSSFCNNRGLDKSSLKAEIAFAAYLNQNFKWNYTYNSKRKDLNFFYSNFRKGVHTKLAERGF